MPEGIFKYVYLACFLAGLGVRTVSMARVPNWWRKKDLTATDHGPLSEKLLMLPVFLGMQLLPILYLVTAWFDGADYGLPVQAGAAISAGPAFWMRRFSFCAVGPRSRSGVLRRKASRPPLCSIVRIARADRRTLTVWPKRSL